MEKLQSVLNDKESLAQIGELASMLTSGQGEQPAPAAPANENPIGDISKLMQLSGALSQAGKGDKNIALLVALRPLLKEENQAKLDRVVRLFRLMALWPMIKESGLLGGDLFGGL
ncbi:MAG: hypothetical protein IJ561_02620 [Ruminococcus sp.]|nr:hypothetical protein [Ruminococcus sp.]